MFCCVQSESGLSYLKDTADLRGFMYEVYLMEDHNFKQSFYREKKHRKSVKNHVLFMLFQMQQRKLLFSLSV